MPQPKPPRARQGRHRGLPVVEANRLNNVLDSGGRIIAFFTLGTVYLIGGGVTVMRSTTASSSHRALAAAAVCGVVLSVVSFWLYLRPGFLTEETWRQPKRRYLAGVALRHVWFCIVPVALAASYLVDQRG